MRILLIGIVAVVLAAGLALVSTPAPADAATKHAGFPDITPYGGYLGNYLAPDGSRVYCIDSPLPWPSGTTSGPALVDGIVTTWGALLPAESLQKLNYVLLAYGQTDDPVQAAAVAAFVNAYTSGWARDLGAGYAAGAWYLNGNVTVAAVYDAIWADAQANAVPVDSAALTLDMTDATTGTLTVSASRPGATGTVSLSGAVRAHDGSAEFTVGAAESIGLRGIPADDAREYVVGATVEFTAPTPAAPHLTLYQTDGQQRTVRGGTTGSNSFSAATSTAPLALDFTPVLTTVVASDIVEVGSPFIDVVTAAVAPASRPWRSRADGGAVPVVAEGVLYGPFAQAPVTSTAVPAGAPEVGRETLTLTGPGEYASSGSLVATEPGYYTWVWGIAAGRQDAVGRAALPLDYSFSSSFGLVEETHRVPTPLRRLAATGTAPQGAAVVGVGLVVTGVLAICGGNNRRRRALALR